MPTEYGRPIVEEIKKLGEAYRAEIATYVPEAKKALTRRHWKEVRNNPATIGQLAEKYGQSKVMQWAQHQHGIDQMEASK